MHAVALTRKLRWKLGVPMWILLQLGTTLHHARGNIRIGG
jgi:hypothetical protein